MQWTRHVLADRYELGPVLGQGGMARVYRALDRQLDRPVAVKVLSPPFDRDRSFVERFRREARAAAGLGHPNIVTVFDSGSDGGTHFIVTELVEGETLGERLRRDGPMEPAEAISVAVDVCRALAAAHARGVIHRDVKPGNVMLLPDGRVKVVDFGIARAAGSDTLTGTGVVLGSTAYLSPEQAGGGPVDARADLYALGCVVYEMLTGRAPFSADTPIATVYRHVNEEAEPPSAFAPVPAELEAIVLRCLEKDPRRRFGSAEELERTLLAVRVPGSGDTMPLEAAGASTAPITVAAAGDRTTTPRPVTPARSGRPPRSRRPWLIAAAVVAVLVALAAVLIAASDPPRPRREARDAARDAVRESLPSEAPLSFTNAWSGLISEIGSAQATEDLSDHAADELVKGANELLDAYREGDPEKVGEALSKLEEELGKAAEDGEITTEAFDAIDQAIADLAVALQDEGVLAVASPTEDVSDDDSSGEGSSGEGPPPHAEANGQDEGEG